MAGAQSDTSIDGFDAFFGRLKLPYLGLIYHQNVSYIESPNIDGFENLSLKIDGFNHTRRTHADEAPAWNRLFEFCHCSQ